MRRCLRCKKNEAIWIEAMQEYGLCGECADADLRASLQRTIETRLTRIGIPKRYLKARLDDFPNLNLDPEVGQFVIGPVDTGKTHLLAAFCREIVLRNKKCLFIKAPQFFEAMREDLEKSKQKIEAVKHTDYLFVDDLGAERLTDWVFECWYRIIDYRYSEEKHMTVSLNSVNSLDERLFRRLRDMTTYLEMK